MPFDSPAIIEDAFNKPLGIRQGGHGNDPDRRMIRAVGNDNIIEACRSNDADFAAFEDGSFIFPEMTLCPDAIYASAIISELSGLRSIRNIVSEIPVYFSKHIRIPFDSMPRTFGKKLGESTAYYNVKNMVHDGSAWKIFMDDGQFMVVLKGQEVHIYAES